MGVRERILTIRLIEKIGKCPAYAKRIGIQVSHPAGSVTFKAAGGAP